MNIKDVQGYAFEGAAHLFAVWLTAARWVSTHSNWALLILLALAAHGIWSKF